MFAMRLPIRAFRSLASLSLAVLFFPSALAQDLQGADAAIRKAAEARTATAKCEDPAGLLTKRLAAFPAEAKAMTPDAAAKAWLGLLDLYLQKPDATEMSMGRWRSPAEFDKLVEVLPSPDSWPAIRTGIRQRTAKEKSLFNASLDLFGEILAGDAASQWGAMAAMMTYKSGGMGSSIVQTYRELAEQTGDRARLVKAIMMGMEEGENGMGRYTQVPDLVALVGPAEAEKTLLAIFKTSKGPVYQIEGTRTKALAKKVALTHIAELRSAQWMLIDSPDDVALYEAFVKKFGPPPAKDNDMGSQWSTTVRYNYILGLVKAGREADALKVAQRDGFGEGGYYRQDDGIDELIGTPRFTNFLAELVKTRRDPGLWNLYILSATRARETDRVVASLKTALGDPKLKAKERADLRRRLAETYLAVDQMDEGLALYRKIADDPTSGPAEGAAAGSRIAYVGMALDKPELAEEGFRLIQKANAANPQTGMGSYSLQMALSPSTDFGKPAEVEKVLIDTYAKTAGTMGGPEMGGPSGAPNPVLAALADFYQDQNRPGDVRVLMDKAPDWGVADAADLAASGSRYAYYSNDDDNAPIGYVAAWTLAKTGEAAKAERLLYRVLAQKPGYDPTYRLLLDLKGADAIPILDRLYSTDQFEERPLIWKAVALKDSGKLEEAEATVRKAISVDPSDGETHGGHRLYAYSVLADIREARGDVAQAKEYRTAVAAIRMAEKADELMAAGLMSRAIAMYEESLRMFGNAYCIQSRLAVQLMQEGRVKEAEEHYRRAYELMPESFGRVETHCMGCEGVFQGQLAQNIAEETFTRLAKETPNKPQVHYLLGYLRETQGRYAEALASYQKAVQLDPDYLNAWKEIQGLSEYITIPAETRRAASSAILRLDPLQKHGTAGVESSSDLAEVWRATERAQSAGDVQADEEIYPLAASAEAISKMEKERMGMGVSYSWGEATPFDLPGAAVAKNALVQSVVQLISNARYSGGMEVGEEE